MRRVMLAFLFPVVLSACGDRPTPMVPDPVSMAIGPTTPSLSSAAPIIRHFPGDSPGPVWYAQLGRGFIPNDGTWAGIVFLRSLACVPAGFNLLDQFDIPAAWGCELMVEGEDWWHDLAVPPPFQRRDRGLGAVPVYFVLWSEIQAATADDILTIGELQNLPSLLVGTASFLEHVEHNTNQPTNHGHETLVSRGTLDDGRTFEFRYNEKFLPETGTHVFPNVKIDFK